MPARWIGEWSDEPTIATTRVRAHSLRGRCAHSSGAQASMDPLPRIAYAMRGINVHDRQ